MAGSDEDRFRVRPGKVRSRGDAGAKRFTSQVLRATQKAASGARPPLARAHVAEPRRRAAAMSRRG